MLLIFVLLNKLITNVWLFAYPKPNRSEYLGGLIPDFQVDDTQVH